MRLVGPRLVGAVARRTVKEVMPSHELHRCGRRVGRRHRRLVGTEEELGRRRVVCGAPIDGEGRLARTGEADVHVVRLARAFSVVEARFGDRRNRHLVAATAWLIRKRSRFRGHAAAVAASARRGAARRARGRVAGAATRRARAAATRRRTVRRSGDRPVVARGATEAKGEGESRHGTECGGTKKAHH